jgi:hypothetical protein
MTAEERFWSKVQKTEGCWLWMTGKNWGGYGIFSVGEKRVVAHRFSYELHAGPVPAGMELDHLCRTRHCVNPAHLEPVTKLENVRRGIGGRKNAIKTHCPAGHAYTPENTYFVRKNSRQCKACTRDAEQTPHYIETRRRYRDSNRELIRQRQRDRRERLRTLKQPTAVEFVHLGLEAQR